MKITFDPAKDAKNRADYGEDRQRGIGYIGARLFYVAFVDRDDTRRIISLRKATKTEVNLYARS